MIIRLYNTSDYKAAVALWHNTQGVCLCEKCVYDDSPERVERFTARNPSSCFVAEENGGVIGTIFAGHDGRTGFIYRLTVAERFKRQGVGKALAGKVIEALKNEGINKIELSVLSDNESGNAFWEKIGFKENSGAVMRSMRLFKKSEV